MKLLIFFILFVMPVTLNAKTQLKQQASQYFDVYAKRQNFSALMEFYAEDVQFEDVLFDVKLTGKRQVQAFLNWKRGKFDRLGNSKILNIESLIQSHNQIIAKGQFHEFKFNGKKMGPWRFIIWLEFNEDGKIIKHEDWINYTPKQINIGE